MSCEEEEVKQKNLVPFHYTIPTLKSDKNYELEIPIEIPYPGSVSELTQRIITNFKLPCYVEKGKGFTQKILCFTPIFTLITFTELQPSLAEFVKTKTIEFYDEVANETVKKCRSSSIDVEEVIKKWEKLYKEVSYHRVSFWVCVWYLYDIEIFSFRRPWSMEIKEEHRIVKYFLMFIIN